MTSLMLDVARGGSVEDPRPFHQTSLLLHLANTALVFWLLYLLLGRMWLSLGLAIAFGVHPISVEVVGWVAERKTPLATFWSLGSLVAYVRSTRDGAWKGWRAVSVASFALALLAKPTSVPLPALLFVLDWWPLRRLSGKVLWEKVPYVVLGLAAAVITVVSQARSAAVLTPGESSITRTVLTVPHNLVFYLREWLWPAGLTPHHPYPPSFGWGDPGVQIGLVGTALLVAGLVVSLPRTRAVTAGWLVFFFAILPTLGILGFTPVIVHDKYLYLPSVGFCLVAVWALGEGVRRLDRHRRVASVAVVILLIGWIGRLSMETRAYIPRWQDAESLHRHMVEMRPDAVMALDDLAGLYLREGKTAEAVSVLERAVVIDPDFPPVLNNLGVARFQQGRAEEATQLFQRAVAGYPGLHSARNNLGRALARQGRLEEAIEQFRAVLEDNPHHVAAMENLARAQRDLGRTDEAESSYRELLALAPWSLEARLEFAEMLEREGRSAAAESLLVEGRALHSGEAEIPHRLALLCARSRRLPEAIELFRTALALDSNRPVTHNNLGIAWIMTGEPDSARAHFEAALRLDPDYAEARRNLERLEPPAPVGSESESTSP